MLILLTVALIATVVYSIVVSYKLGRRGDRALEAKLKTIDKLERQAHDEYYDMIDDRNGHNRSAKEAMFEMFIEPKLELIRALRTELLREQKCGALSPADCSRPSCPIHWPAG